MMPTLSLPNNSSSNSNNNNSSSNSSSSNNNNSSSSSSNSSSSSRTTRAPQTLPTTSATATPLSTTTWHRTTCLSSLRAATRPPTVSPPCPLWTESPMARTAPCGGTAALSTESTATHTSRMDPVWQVAQTNIKRLAF